MKKFYTALATVALCASTCLGGVTLKNASSFKGFRHVEGKNVPENALKKVATPVVAAKAFNEGPKHQLKAQSVADIAGDYSITLGDYYNGENSRYEFTTTATISDLEGFVMLDCEEFPTVTLGVFNAETSTLIFDALEFGELQLGTTTYYLRFEPYVYDYSVEDLVPQAITADYNEATGTFTFTDPDGGDPGFSWVAYKDENYSTPAGYLEILDVVSLVKTGSNAGPGEEDSEWESVGNCEFVDAWIMPCYGVDPAEFPIVAELQRNKNNKNLFRVWEPYKNSAIAPYNQSTLKGQIVIDITDPDHVRVLAGYPAGFKNNNGDFYVFDLLGYQIFGYGNAWDESYAEDLYEWMEEHDQPFSTFKDNVVTVNRSVFDISADCTKAYTWNNNPYVVSTFTFPEGAVSGVSSVATDTNADAPVEYFNLQGMRVAAPQAGQLVIKRQGTSVEKLTVR